MPSSIMEAGGPSSPYSLVTDVTDVRGPRTVTTRAFLEVSFEASVGAAVLSVVAFPFSPAKAAAFAFSRSAFVGICFGTNSSGSYDSSAHACADHTSVRGESACAKRVDTHTRARFAKTRKPGAERNTNGSAPCDLKASKFINSPKAVGPATSLNSAVLLVERKK